MSSLDPQPFLLRFSLQLFVLEGYRGLLVMYAVADIYFVFQQIFDLGYYPGIPLAFGLFLNNMSEPSVFLIIYPRVRRYLFLAESFADFCGSHTMCGKVKYFLNDPPRVLIGYQFALDLGVFFVAYWRYIAHMRSVMESGI